MKNNKKLVLFGCFSGCITFCIMMILFLVLSYAPFGSNSLATMDANIQYLDFFAYFKDVLAGKNNISYSFGKMLGGNNVAVYSYYLSSPLNLLVIFFDKNNLTAFFDILVALKLGIASVTMFIYLTFRFENNLKYEFSVLLSICYALCQYNIAQSSNIMWLDGVYMLPLILLGIFYLVKQNKICFLTITVGCSIIINWYTGGINCLFSVVWFFFEYFYSHYAETLKTFKSVLCSKDFFVRVARYMISLIIGLLLSACLFLPTMAALSGGRGGIDWTAFTKDFTGNILSAVQAYSLGATSSYGVVSLFCGSLPVIGCIGFFFLRKIPKRQKVIVGVLLCVVILLFYMGPLVFLFSLLKKVGSYWYRYSYVGIFALVFIAALFFAKTKRKLPRCFYIKSAAGFALVLLISYYINKGQSLQLILKTCICCMIVAGVLTFYEHMKYARRYLACLLAGVIILEMGYNTVLLMQKYHVANVTKFSNYVSEQETAVGTIMSDDDGLYRISETSTRSVKDGNLTANYNEALAYGYWSISGYTSDPDYLQTTLLDRLGYRQNGNNMCIVNTSILAADSLLGVKYVLSSYEINGLVKVDSAETQYNGKNIYFNPYAVSMAFTYDRNKYENYAVSDEEQNPFEYQNMLYSQLLGEDVDLYISVDVEKTEQDGGLIYIITVPEGNYSLYGDIEWFSEMNATLNVNDSYEIGYAQNLSQSVFYIPISEEDSEAVVTLNANENKVSHEYFYVLDLDVLGKVTEQLNSGTASSMEIENGYARFEVTGKTGDSLYISIPYDEGWSITRNGETVEADLVADCMISIPLEEGDNVIEMNYHVPYLYVGFAFSGVGIVFLLIIAFFDKKRGLCRRNH